MTIARGYLIACGALLSSVTALACPDIDGMLDRNCDGRITITAFGDSITYGRGDSKGLGYPGRIEALFQGVRVQNYGIPGETSQRGRMRASRVFHKEPESDFVVILEGVNDYWDLYHSATRTKSNLMSIKRAGGDIDAVILLASLTPVKRSFQKSWVQNVNRLIKSSVKVDFYALGDRIIGRDQLHPNSRGYDRMTERVVETIWRETPRHRPRDIDRDGIYDFAEARYGTTVGTSDTDSDGLTDGQEVFGYRTDPRIPDSDGDTITDAEEVLTLGSDPLRAIPGAPTILGISALPS